MTICKMLAISLIMSCVKEKCFGLTDMPSRALIIGICVICSIMWLIRTYVLVSLGLVWILCRIYRHYFVQIEETQQISSNMNVCIVGSGFSGIAMGVKLKRLGIRHRIVEKASFLGGTWLNNRYPGCACDIPSHLYSYSFAPNPRWSSYFAPQSEILQYLADVASAHNLLIDYNKIVIAATWEDSRGVWRISFKDGEIYEANILVSACGALHVPLIPTFPGINNFTGPAFHSAAWQKEHDLCGKKVALIGTGASAVQIVPSIVDKVQHLYVFQRTPTWVPPKSDMVYSERTKWVFNHFPCIMHLHRFLIHLQYEFHYYALYHISSPLLNLGRGLLEGQLRSRVPDTSLQEQLVPKFRPGCKRITPSNAYLEAFSRNNVTLISQPIVEIKKSSIKMQENDEYKVDVIIFATGFSPSDSYRPFSIQCNNLFLESQIKDTPRAYLGMCYPGFPNLFYLLGPNTVLGHNSAIFMIECQVNYVEECIRQMESHNIKNLAVKRRANERYQNWLTKTMKTKVFGSGCTSWYRNKKGINFTLWPTDCTRYWWWTRKVNLNDFVCQY